MTCTEADPCPVYLELSAVGAVADRIVLAGNVHSAETTLYSVLLGSEDRGRNWREIFDRKRGCGFDRIQFLDAQHGWISGGLLSPLPRDPFLLTTIDGGATWRERPIFSEETSGTILQFWFDSLGAGSLLLDRMQAAESARYELYESDNGGETWVVRRASNRPIPLKRAEGATNSPGWRLRADARTKSYLIEKLERERWVSVASFLVPLGACRPAVPVTGPPPEEPSPEEPRPVTPPSKPPTLQRPPS
jgi:hypothetical protein